MKTILTVVLELLLVLVVHLVKFLLLDPKRKAIATMNLARLETT